MNDTSFAVAAAAWKAFVPLLGDNDDWCDYLPIRLRPALNTPATGAVTDSTRPDLTIDMYVNCSDVFAWGTADLEPITEETLPIFLAAIDVYQHYETSLDRDTSFPYIPLMLYAAEVRQMQPMPRQFRDDSVYTPLFTHLPPNPGGYYGDKFDPVDEENEVGAEPESGSTVTPESPCRAIAATKPTTTELPHYHITPDDITIAQIAQHFDSITDSWDIRPSFTQQPFLAWEIGGYAACLDGHERFLTSPITSPIDAANFLVAYQDTRDRMADLQQSNPEAYTKLVWCPVTPEYDAANWCVTDRLAAAHPTIMPPAQPLPDTLN